VIHRARMVRWLLAIGLVVVASAGAPGRAFAADTPDSAEQSYYDALAVMHAIPNPQFLRLGYHLTQVLGGGQPRQEDVQAAERTEDGAVRYKNALGAEDHPERRSFFYIRPDLFLKPSTAASAQQFGIVTDTPYKVIGSTRTHTHYTITDASADTTADCPGATHLRLRPKPGADPFYYNLRELWIRPENGRICKAVAVWNAGIYLVHRFSMEFTLDVAAETGLIYRWSSAGVAHAGPFQTRYHVDGSYADVTAESSAPAGFFDR
jgi:hypothetical protein